MKKSRVRNARFYKGLGVAIRLARGIASKSQMNVADHLDVSFQQLQKYEDGRNRIPVDRLVALSNYLAVPLHQFVALTTVATNGDDEGPDLSLSVADIRFLTCWKSLADEDRKLIHSLARRLVAVSGERV